MAFGFVERISDRLYAEIVPKRTAKILVPIVQKWIDKNTEYLITDEWKSYNSLKKKSYNHETIKHKENFVRPDNHIIHTQTIENRWGLIKALLKKRGKISRLRFQEKLEETVWRVMNRANIEQKLFDIICEKTHNV